MATRTSGLSHPLQVSGKYFPTSPVDLRLHVTEKEAGHVVAQAARHLVHPLEFFAARFPRHAAHTNVICLAIVVDKRVGFVRADRDVDGEHILARLGLPHP